MTGVDVARRAGVSRTTVSYILNDDQTQSFTEETRARVHAAASELGYVPNRAARALRLGRSSTVLMPLPGVYLSPLWAGIVDATARALAARGHALVADFTSYGSPEAQVEAGLRLQPAVVIDTMAVERRIITMFEAQGALVLTSRPSLAADPFAEPGHRARLMQVEHLLARGRRRMASIGVAGKEDESRQGKAIEKLLRTRCRKAGASFEAHTLDPADPIPVRALVAEIAGRVDGACVVNDHLAVALVSACAAAGLRVPEDLAIVGLDDHPIAAALSPTLTTIAWDLEAFGATIAEGVESALAGQRASLGVEAMACHVVERESA
ncbi:MAG: hypothetical protein QOG87_1667 [Actinomycetota bacterium]